MTPTTKLTLVRTFPKVKDKLNGNVHFLKNDDRTNCGILLDIDIPYTIMFGADIAELDCGKCLQTYKNLTRTEEDIPKCKVCGRHQYDRHDPSCTYGEPGKSKPKVLKIHCL